MCTHVKCIQPQCVALQYSLPSLHLTRMALTSSAVTSSIQTPLLSFLLSFLEYHWMFASSFSTQIFDRFHQAWASPVFQWISIFLAVCTAVCPSVPIVVSASSQLAAIVCGRALMQSFHVTVVSPVKLVCGEHRSCTCFGILSMLHLDSVANLVAIIPQQKWQGQQVLSCRTRSNFLTSAFATWNHTQDWHMCTLSKGCLCWPSVLFQMQEQSTIEVKWHNQFTYQTLKATYTITWEVYTGWDHMQMQRSTVGVTYWMQHRPTTCYKQIMTADSDWCARDQVRNSKHSTFNLFCLRRAVGSTTARRKQHGKFILHWQAIFTHA